MDKFLKKYYKQLHFNSMPADVRARFFDWVRNDTLTDDMRNWVRDYLQHQPAPNNNQLIVNANGNYVPNALPNPINPNNANNNGLSDDEAKELFIAFQQAFAGMAADLNSFKDTDHQSRDFVNHYFGSGKIFNTSPATQNCVDGINAILGLFRDPQVGAQVQRIVLASESSGKKLFDNQGKLNEFITKCNQGRYNTDGSIQSKIQKIASALENAAWSYSGTAVGAAIEKIHSHLSNVMAPDAFALNPANINPNMLTNFRALLAAPYDKEYQTGLLQTLYYNKTIRDRFAKYDNGTITGPINKAEENVNWQDKSKDNYVDPKTKDVLTPLQRIQEWASDTYADTLKKYEELRGGHKFFSQEAKDICSAMDKIKDKIKPVDGLGKILEKKSDIEKKLNNPVARQHFQWFTETMESIASKMPKAVEGAWKDATQMKAVIDQIILKATDPRNDDPHAVEKAKTAMEIMTAMKYGMMTSKIMGALKDDKELFSLFSNKDLSWNKSEGVQFVTKAFDKTVRAAFLGVGYGVTIVKNKIKLSGMKYKDRDNQHGLLAQRFNEENANKQQALRDQNTADTATIVQRQQDLQNINTGQNAVNAQNIQNMTNTVLPQLNQNYQQATGARQTAEQNFNRISGATQSARNRLQVDANWQNQHNSLHNEMVQEFRTINNLRRQIAALPNDPVGDARRDMLNEQLKEHIKIYDDKRQEMANIDNVHNAYTPQQQNADRLAEQQYNNAQNVLNTATTTETNAKQAHDDLTERIQQFNDATREIQELTRAVNDRNQALQNWSQANLNRFVELENHWNFLQGKTTTWNLSQKRAQSRFDRNKQAMLQQHISQYGLAA